MIVRRVFYSILVVVVLLALFNMLVKMQDPSSVYEKLNIAPDSSAETFKLTREKIEKYQKRLSKHKERLNKIGKLNMDKFIGSDSIVSASGSLEWTQRDMSELFLDIIEQVKEKNKDSLPPEAIETVFNPLLFMIVSMRELGGNISAEHWTDRINFDIEDNGHGCYGFLQIQDSKVLSNSYKLSVKGKIYEIPQGLSLANYVSRGNENDTKFFIFSIAWFYEEQAKLYQSLSTSEGKDTLTETIGEALLSDIKNDLYFFSTISGTNHHLPALYYVNERARDSVSISEDYGLSAYPFTNIQFYKSLKHYAENRDKFIDNLAADKNLRYIGGSWVTIVERMKTLGIWNSFLSETGWSEDKLTAYPHGSSMLLHTYNDAWNGYLIFKEYSEDTIRGGR